ncbi:MAG: carboxypeptidase-like regulatory domain-containing protein [Planctomycetota bacterium]
MTKTFRILSVLALLVSASAVSVDSALADGPGGPGNHHHAAGRIGGVVSTSEGRAVPGAVVVLRHGDVAVARTQTNREGVYVFERVRPGHYTVVAAKEGVGRGAARAAVRSGQTVRAPITLNH